MPVQTSVASAPLARRQGNVVPIEEGLHKHPLKICLLGYRSHPYSGGQGIYIKYLSKALVEAGHRVDVISGQPYPQVDPRVRLIKMPGLDLFENGLMSLRPRHLTSLTNIIEWCSKLTGGFGEPYCFGRRAVKYLNQYGRDYDIIHDNQCLAYGMLELQEQGFPLVTTIHHPITSDLSIAVAAAKNIRERFFIRRWHSFLVMQRKVAAKLHNVVTVSERSRDDIAKSFGLPVDSISLVYNGIDTDEFTPRKDIARIPQRIMATASADQPLKGLSYLLDALAQVRRQYPDTELLLVGKPKPDGETAKQIERLGLGDCIRTVTGISTEQLVAYYAEAELAIVPSVYEGFGLPAGEAMACGVPVISTDGGALPEVTGDAAITVPAKNADAIAAAVIELFEDPQRRALMSQAGRQRMEEVFCWQRVAVQMTDYYWRVIDHANR